MLQNEENQKLLKSDEKQKSIKSDETQDDSLDMILNPHIYALEDTLKAIYKTENIDEKNELIDELTVIFTKDDILYNRKIQLKFPELLNLLKNEDLYDHSCILLSDIVRHKPVIQEIFFLLKIFNFLNFNKYKSTMSLVFSMCYGNKKNTEYFFNEIYNQERDCKEELVEILKNQ